MSSHQSDNNRAPSKLYDTFRSKATVDLTVFPDREFYRPSASYDALDYHQSCDRNRRNRDDRLRDESDRSPGMMAPSSYGMIRQQNQRRPQENQLDHLQQNQRNKIVSPERLPESHHHIMTPSSVQPHEYRHSHADRREECGRANVSTNWAMKEEPLSSRRSSLQSDISNGREFVPTHRVDLRDCRAGDENQRQLSVVADHGAWYNLGKKKKKKPAVVGDGSRSSLGSLAATDIQNQMFDTRSAYDLDTRSCVTSLPGGSLVAGVQRPTGISNHLAPPSKKKKGWGAIFGGGSKKKEGSNPASPAPSSPAQSSLAPSSRALEVRSTQNASARQLPAFPSGEKEDDAVSDVSGYTGLSGVSGRPVTDFGDAVAKTNKKKKGLMAKLFGSSKSKSEKGDGLTPQTLAELNSQLGRPEDLIMTVPTNLSEFQGESVEQRRDRLRQETREDFLHALSRVQQRFIARQMREEALQKKSRQARINNIKETGVGSSPTANGDFSGLTAAFGGVEVKDLNALCDLTSVDWSKVESGSASDTLQMTFVLNKLRKLVNDLFDDDAFRNSMNELEQVRLNC